MQPRVEVDPHQFGRVQQLLDALERLGISYADVTAQLEREGVQKFVTSWEELLQGVRAELDKVTA